MCICRWRIRCPLRLVSVDEASCRIHLKCWLWASEETLESTDRRAPALAGRIPRKRLSSEKTRLWRARPAKAGALRSSQVFSAELSLGKAGRRGIGHHLHLSQLERIYSE